MPGNNHMTKVNLSGELFSQNDLLNMKHHQRRPCIHKFNFCLIFVHIVKDKTPNTLESDEFNAHITIIPHENHRILSSIHFCVGFVEL